MEQAEPAQPLAERAPDQDYLAPFLSPPGASETRDGLGGRVLGLPGGALCGVLAVAVAMVVLTYAIHVLVGPASLLFVGGLSAIFE